MSNKELIFIKFSKDKEIVLECGITDTGLDYEHEIRVIIHTQKIKEEKVAL